MKTFPREMFLPMCKSDDEWLALDYQPTLYAAADDATDWASKYGSDIRVLHLTFDLQTAAPETFRDVTDDAKALARGWLASRDESPPAWLMAAE